LLQDLRMELSGHGKSDIFRAILLFDEIIRKNQTRPCIYGRCKDGRGLWIGQILCTQVKWVCCLSSQSSRAFKALQCDMCENANSRTFGESVSCRFLEAAWPRIVPIYWRFSPSWYPYNCDWYIQSSRRFSRSSIHQQ
jgi:hypothetical protein